MHTCEKDLEKLYNVYNAKDTEWMTCVMCIWNENKCKIEIRHVIV